MVSPMLTGAPMGLLVRQFRPWCCSVMDLLLLSCFGMDSLCLRFSVVIFCSLKFPIRLGAP